jgi:hypothetical protein
MNAKLNCSGLCRSLLALAACSAAFAADGTPPVRVELIEPFAFTYGSEYAVMFVRITNTGNTPLLFTGLGKESDLQFENPPPVSGEPSEFVPLWSKRFAFTNMLPRVKEGQSIEPGEALVLSQLDFDDDYFSHAQWEFPRVRPHFRVGAGEWVAGEWHDRKLLPTPDLTKVASLYDYKLGGSGPIHSVIELSAEGETWLFGSRLARDSKIIGERGRVDRRLCRLPDGKLPVSIVHDEAERLMTIRFGNGEEDVVINTRSGMPVSGSERTVPHLHQWFKLAGRPFTDVYRQWKGIPVPMPKTAVAHPNQSGSPEMPGKAPSNTGGTPDPASGSGSQGGLFLIVVVVIFALAVGAWIMRKRRKSQSGTDLS